MNRLYVIAKEWLYFWNNLERRPLTHYSIVSCIQHNDACFVIAFSQILMSSKLLHITYIVSTVWTYRVSAPGLSCESPHRLLEASWMDQWLITSAFKRRIMARDWKSVSEWTSERVSDWTRQHVRGKAGQWVDGTNEQVTNKCWATKLCSWSMNQWTNGPASDIFTKCFLVSMFHEIKFALEQTTESIECTSVTNTHVNCSKKT